MIMDEVDKRQIEEAKKALMAEKERIESAAHPDKPTDGDYLRDAEYRAAAVTYIEAIEPVISRADDERESVTGGWPGEELSSKEVSELKDAAAEVDDLLNPLGGTIYSLHGVYTGMHVLNKIKRRIQEYERMC